MRDPLGSIELSKTSALRYLNHPLPDEHFLHSELARSLVAKGQIIPFEFEKPLRIRSPRIPFVSHPHEWCNAQFVDAARLTLNISESILGDGFDLKDASAWNVVFDGCKPVFCDHLSFQKINKPTWWAFSQFFRHFVFPLTLSKYKRINAKVAFKLYRDGIDAEFTRSILGLRRFLTRQWIFMLSPGRTAPAEKSTLPPNGGPRHPKPYHGNLYNLCSWALQGVSALESRNSTWIDYTKERNHYTDQAAQTKKRVVAGWLESIKPDWVTDLGCNTGEFSRLALNSARSGVVAVDLDHECIQNIYLSSRGLNIYPVLANLDDLQAGRGWSGTEFPGLGERLSEHADLVLMLALVHHLAISSSIPFKRIAQLAHKLTTKYLIIELLDSNDTLVQHLCVQRNRSPEDFSLEKQRAAFDEFFEKTHEVVIPQTARHLILMTKKNVC